MDNYYLKLQKEIDQNIKNKLKGDSLFYHLKLPPELIQYDVSSPKQRKFREKNIFQKDQNLNQNFYGVSHDNFQISPKNKTTNRKDYNSMSPLVKNGQSLINLNSSMKTPLRYLSEFEGNSRIYYPSPQKHAFIPSFGFNNSNGQFRKSIDVDKRNVLMHTLRRDK
jgi:hypothetical protein